MKVITAKILDPTHLELSEPISVKPGNTIQISIPDDGDGANMWREVAKQNFLKAYSDTDAVYDKL